MSNHLTVAVAIDIGGTKIAGALVDSDGNVVANHKDHAQWTCPTPRIGGNDVAKAVAKIVALVNEKAQELGYAPVACGIGSAGVIDPSGRFIASATEAIPGWTGTQLADIVEAETGLTTIIENDVHAHARGEAWLGAGKGHKSVLMVAVGTGIGGAFIVDGEIVRGAAGLAGHVGHLVTSVGRGFECSCGVDGHLEAIASGPGMVRLANHRGATVTDGYDLVAQATAGNEICMQTITDAATATGEIIAGLVNCFDPEIVILGGGIANAENELYWNALVSAYGEQLMPALKKVPMVVASLGGAAPQAGAAQLAFAHVAKRAG
ncbi:ROK family protein [Gleimia coleocanis DSM 15436]|uniref:ROK family protein n=1 Tax=Gleimia coleocanis DSM 15436 TaxID=525245 RepID=C0W1Z7_9ACTO|nr:ROK family protein [Gleimia coleocanis]EEH63211.1 ROK family protein [Gleimia coleocanis DSM 15436]